MSSIQSFLFVFQIVLSVLIILFVLLQQNDEDSLSGIGGGANSKMLSKRSSGTPISKATMVVFILFMLNSLLLATFSARKIGSEESNLKNFVNIESKNK